MSLTRELDRRGVVIGGVERPYWVCTPIADRPTGIVLSLHGRGTSADFQAGFSGMGGLAASAGAVVVFPQGSLGTERDYTWDLAGDVPYLAAVIDAVRTAHPDVGARVCVAGMSAGARMACRYAADRAEDVAVLAAVAGLAAPQAAPARPVPVVAFHGLADRAAGGGGASGGRRRERGGSRPRQGMRERVAGMPGGVAGEDGGRGRRTVTAGTGRVERAGRDGGGADMVGTAGRYGGGGRAATMSRLKCVSAAPGRTGGHPRAGAPNAGHGLQTTRVRSVGS